MRPARIERGLDRAHQLELDRRSCSATSSSRFSWPMPCSALMLPPCARDQIVHDAVRALGVVHERRARPTPSGADEVVVQVAVAQVAEDRRGARPETRRAARPRTRRRNAGIADTGSEMSCLMFGPSRRCASLMFSRSAHSRSRLLAPIARPSRRRAAPRVDGLGERRLQRFAASGASRALSSACTSTYHGWPGSGSGEPGMVLARQRRARTRS